MCFGLIGMERDQFGTFYHSIPKDGSLKIHSEWCNKEWYCRFFNHNRTIVRLVVKFNGIPILI